jgi:hypothetical protein
MYFRGRNIFARQLLVAEIKDEAELTDRITRLATWINSTDRLRADLGAVSHEPAIAANPTRRHVDGTRVS